LFDSNNEARYLTAPNCIYMFNKDYPKGSV
jgi:hypothetical protein